MSTQQPPEPRPPPETRPLAAQPPEEASTEATQAAAYAGALTAVHLAIIAWLLPESGGTPDISLDDPVSVRVAIGNQFDTHRDTLRDRIETMTIEGARSGRRAAVRRHDLDIDPDDFRRETPRALREIATTASRETHTRQARDIARSIADAHQAGLSVEEIATRLKQDVFPEMRQWEARRLARTQVHTGAERGNLAAYRTAGVPEVMWLSAFLPTSRETHVATSGQTRQTGDLFDLAGHACAHPGDPRLPVSHVVNCMCRLIPAP